MVVNDVSISRKHASLKVGETSCTVTDLGSGNNINNNLYKKLVNGTYIDGK